MRLIIPLSPSSFLTDADCHSNSHYNSLSEGPTSHAQPQAREHLDRRIAPVSGLPKTHCRSISRSRSLEKSVMHCGRRDRTADIRSEVGVLVVRFEDLYEKLKRKDGLGLGVVKVPTAGRKVKVEGDQIRIVGREVLALAALCGCCSPLLFDHIRLPGTAIPMFFTFQHVSSSCCVMPCRRKQCIA